MFKQSVSRPLHKFFQLEAASGIVLLLCTVVALIWANSPWGYLYTSFWDWNFSGISLHHGINDGLMTLFFFIVGLEIKREMDVGELSSFKKAFLPIFAAFGGMIVPALIFYVINHGTPAVRGWGIPMATDIAFALGILSLMGKRIPPALKVLLTALAIIDDLGAVLVIAIFYTLKISWLSLGLSVLIFTLLLLMNHFTILRTWLYAILGCALWFAILKSGIHPTIAGVLTAMAIPNHFGFLERIEQKLHAWVSFGIMPLFALANAGIAFGHSGTLSSIQPVFLGVLFGLVVGKQLGITLFAFLSVRCGWAKLPIDVSWQHIYGIACLGGIGFTMSMFISALAFPEGIFLAEAKLGILVASTTAIVFGIIVLTRKSFD